MNKILPTEIDRHNKNMRNHVQHKLGKGGLLLALAASGSTDKPVQGDGDIILMHRVGNGTTGLLQTPKTYVAPMAVWYKGEEPVLEICDIPRVMRGEKMVHGAMQSVADALSQRVDDKTFVYDS
jgi:hypothetical protein